MSDVSFGGNFGRKRHTFLQTSPIIKTKTVIQEIPVPLVDLERLSRINKSLEEFRRRLFQFNNQLDDLLLFDYEILEDLSE